MSAIFCGMPPHEHGHYSDSCAFIDHSDHVRFRSGALTFVAVVVVAGVTVVNAVAVVGIAVVVVVAIFFDVVVRFCVGLTVMGTVMVVESFGAAVTVFGRFSDVVGAGIVAEDSHPASDKTGDVADTVSSGSPITLGLTDSPAKLVIKNSVVAVVSMLADPSGMGIIGA